MKPGTSKTGFRQVKIMKEFVGINRIAFLNLAFGQVHVGEKRLRQRQQRVTVFVLEFLSNI